MNDLLHTNFAIKITLTEVFSLSKIACALGDKSPSGSFKFKSSFFLMYLN